MDTLRVGAAFPDPPFNGMADGGLDVDLITAIGARLGRRVDLIAYEGADFNGIFDGLATGAYDCVIAGTTVTAERSRRAAFAPPYLVSGQSLAVDTARCPAVRSVDDLAGSTIGVQRGNTSQAIAERLVAQGRAKGVRLYDYGGIRTALSDLATGGCDAFMKLGPVLTELVRSIDGVEIVQRGLSREDIAMAVALGDDSTLARIAAAQADLEADGTLQALRRKWLGNPYRDQSLAAH
ncbi:ABC transporter substrate-binding protein [Mycolicibacterium sp.]|uniref:ABC transporter substrate-binding protein n=1 Tax=Mycolicibacterium sp. TaxID=2320850 RepID=UPI001A259BF3|nr:ABC transporter substrate-binding protein [Mycolicibacterium sp.]MBJ7339994.1 amino acid ABC transporter substrate-binding protein [Mycolicibacterium sp.]